MKKFFFVAAIAAFAACNNSGTDAKAADSSSTKMAADSSKMSTDSSKMSADSSKMSADSSKMAADTSKKK